MRAVHESAYKPKLTGETKFVVNIRPINHNGAALSSTIAAANNNNNNIGASEVNRRVSSQESRVKSSSSGVNHMLLSKTQAKCGPICTVISLIAAVLLISGSIYLHLRQKPHLGRLHHNSPEKVVASTPEAIKVPTSATAPLMASASLPGATRESEIFTASAATAKASATTARDSTETSRVWQIMNGGGGARHITEACMQCICRTATECRPAVCGNNMDCGVFRISRPYWLDAGMPALEGDEGSTDNTNTTYGRCVNNMYCATRVVAAYINKYARDCNRNGVIDCRDHIALHLLGPTGCLQSEGVLPQVFARRMEDCFAEYD
ncbi:uncharacterized protein LOC101452634 [Ceratitis capitata]|uniref:uncharacterized protein LOC101452634 n=1 Tax=Ceratitis capitata TaxID=7213 RepID=UPI000329EA68|nr:uncharacterized protein LOC101452634 [Ceratitis capitata]